MHWSLRAAGHSGNISSKGRTWPNFYYLSKVIMTTTTVSTIYPVLVMSLLIILHGLIHLILSIGSSPTNSIPVHRWGNYSTERLSNSPKVTQLISKLAEIRFEPRGSGFRVQMFNLLNSSPKRQGLDVSGWHQNPSQSKVKRRRCPGILCSAALQVDLAQGEGPCSPSCSGPKAVG